MTPDAIRLRRMRFWGHHGVTEAERSSPQEIEMDVEILADVSKAAASDDLAQTVDYEAVYRRCEAIVTHQSFALLEALALACVRAVMENSLVQRATIRVRKPALIEGSTPEIELTRERAR